MLNKNDPLIGAVQEVMKKNQAEREAAKLVNEKFGVHDRKALPHEKQGAWDAAYKQILSEGLHPNQQKLDVHEPEKDKLTKQDFKMLRAKKKPMEEATDGDTTSPSSMGIKKPDYATGTPDYAKPKEQTVNRAAKTSLPAGTMKEEEQIDEKAPPGAKYERMVKHIKDKMSKGGLTKKEKSIAYATAWKAKKKSDVNEGFNNRHSLSVNASAEKQAVADQLNEKVGLPLAARQAQQQAAKNAAMTRSRLAREPKEAPSSIGTRIKQGLGAVDAGVRRFSQGVGGDYVAAAGDYAVKNIGAAVGIGKGTTYSKELEQEKEKSARAELNYPTATKIGAAADTASTVAGVAGLTKGAVKYGLKKFATNKIDDVAKTAVAKADDAVKAAPSVTAAGQKAATAADRFKRASAIRRQVAGAEPKVPPKAPTTQSGVPAVARTPGNKTGIAKSEKVGPWNRIGPNAPARPATPNAAAGNAARMAARQRLAAVAKDKPMQAAVVGGAALAAAKATQPTTAPSTASATPARVLPQTMQRGAEQDKVGVKRAGTSAPAAKPATSATTSASASQTPAKASAPAAKPAAPVQAVRKPQDSSTPAQRAQFNRQIDRGNAAPGTAYKGLGVTTGKTIVQKAAPQVKRPVGTGREK
jgi:hypothetical protein